MSAAPILSSVSLRSDRSTGAGDTDLRGPSGRTRLSVPRPPVVGRRRRQVTPAMIAANRRNALRSTGPRTAAGKAAVRFNALKHGGRAAAGTVLPDESPTEYQAHVDATLAEFAPADAGTAVLVRRLADLSWRIRRTNEAEAKLAWERHDDPALADDVKGEVDLLLHFIRIEAKLTAQFIRVCRELMKRQRENSDEATKRRCDEGVDGRSHGWSADTFSGNERSREPAGKITQADEQTRGPAAANTPVDEQSRRRMTTQNYHNLDEPSRGRMEGTISVADQSRGGPRKLLVGGSSFGLNAAAEPGLRNHFATPPAVTFQRKSFGVSVHHLSGQNGASCSAISNANAASVIQRGCDLLGARTSTSAFLSQ